MANEEKMICPNCKVEMNFHALTVDYTQGDGKHESVDQEFGGILEEFHSCPKCGMTATRDKEKAAYGVGERSYETR
jgi:hypothetical protein